MTEADATTDWPDAHVSSSPPPPPEAEPGPEPTLAGPVAAREILWRGLDLNLAASRDIRRAAIHVGLLSLASAGPVVASFVALGERIERFQRSTVSAQLASIEALQGARNLVLVALVIAAGSILALAIDSQLLAVDIIARKARGDRFDFRSSLELARMRFWRLLRANILIGITLLVPRWVFEQIVAPGGVVRESQFVVLTIAGVVLSIPFAYVAACIVLGRLGARDSVRRSIQVARSRPSLAVVIAIVNTVFQTVALFALGAGAEILVRIADALGLGNASGLGLIPLAIVIGLGIAAAGSLVMTIAALAAGPQVVAFLRLTGEARGLDSLRDPDNPFATPRREPLVTRGMKIALVADAALAGIALIQLVS